jgi:16S rRNA (guanine527-N7)-methyltransferase
MNGATSPPERHLRELAGGLGLELSEAEGARLTAYGELLRRWNRIHNLTAVDEPGELLTHHLLDCLAIVRPLDEALRSAGLIAPGVAAAQTELEFLDAGSGAGLPGIPLAIVRPRWHGWLVDAVGKKCAFLQQAVVELGLSNVEVRHARLERVSLPRCALVVSRAFASLRDFIAVTRGHIAPGGLWAAMKGRDAEAELRALAPDLSTAARFVETITLRVPRLDEERRLVVLRAPAAPPAGSAPDGEASSPPARRAGAAHPLG